MPEDTITQPNPIVTTAVPQPVVGGTSESTSTVNVVTPSQPVTPPSQTKKRNLKLIILALVMLIFAIIISVGTYLFLTSINNSQKSTPITKILRIGLSLDTLKELRWSQDRDLITKRARELGASVVTFVANSDDKTQISQIQNLIAQKVDVLIIVAHNATALSGVVDEAHKAGIKVIAYDRMIVMSNPDLYISFDSTKVGSTSAEYVLKAIPQSVRVANVAFVGGSETDNNAFLVKQGAMGILDPMVAKGKVKIVYNQFTPNWDPDVAYKNFNSFLNTGVKVDAVVASNDGTAMGVIQSLIAHGLAGKVPVSGQDAELSAIKRVISGTQTVTLYKPLRLEAFSAAENAVMFANGKNVKTKAFVNNGKIDVPSILINPIAVTKDNIKETVIKDGFYTSKEVYGSSIAPK